jgi:hypothetical protein
VGKIDQDEDEDSENVEAYEVEGLSWNSRVKKSKENKEKVNRKSLLSYQGDLSNLNVWQKPLQGNEMLLLL